MRPTPRARKAAAVADSGRGSAGHLLRDYWARVNVAGVLHRQHGLPDVSDLLRDLNEARKSEAYGDVVAPKLDAEDVATEIEVYVDSVGKLVRV